MFKLNSLLGLLIVSTTCHAQVTSTSWWTWIAGDSTKNSTGVYGAEGVSASSNKPGARRYSVSWKDTDGSLWMFGGQGYATGGGTGFLNDLWKFDPFNNIWTWMKGDNATGINPVYGTLGISSSNNKPGGRYSCISWTDASGNLWLFGGYGFANDGLGYLNDLWKYDRLTNQWTFVKGDSGTNSYGVYGTQNASSSAHKPGARYGSISWADAVGNLWLFGGYGYAQGGSNDLNDLWKYNIATNIWTWVKGNNTINTLGAYGIKGTADTLNNPGARRYSTGWNDNAGNLYLFGGYGYAASGTFSFLNDLWKYDPNANRWTWINGDSITAAAGVYGLRGTSSANNKPGARYISTGWKDITGNVWLFGGYGYAATDGGYLNDMWKYDIANNEWTWITGENNANNFGVYGNQQNTSTYTPGARQSMLSWTDNSGNLFTFGGHGFTGNGNEGYLNDLWKFSGSASILPLSIISVKAYQQSNNAAIEWTVEMEDGVDKYEIERSANGTSFVHIGFEKANSVSNIKAMYSWTDNSPNEGNNFYRIKTIDRDESVKYSNVVQVKFVNDRRSISIYPNPVVNRVIYLQMKGQQQGTYAVQIFNNTGQQVYKKNIGHKGGSSLHMLQLKKAVMPGIYHLQVNNAEGIIIKKLVISH